MRHDTAGEIARANARTIARAIGCRCLVLTNDFAKCSMGSRQFPVDIRSGIAVDLDPVQFDYRATPFRVIDNGHTVQVNVEPGNSIITNGQRIELLQFHFDLPSSNP